MRDPTLRFWIGSDREGACARGIPIKKANGKPRPIAQDEPLKKIGSFIARKAAMIKLADCLGVNQLAIGTEGGFETIPHACREKLKQPDMILVDFDITDAFNNADVIKIKHKVKEDVPTLYPYVNQTINKKRTVTFQDYKNNKTLVLHSNSGLAQGDGLSPGLFSLSHVDMDKLLIEKHKEVAQYYFADNVDAAGRYDKVLVWAKDYIN